MDIFIKVTHTLFFLAIAVVIYLNQNKNLLTKPTTLAILGVCLAILFFLNSMYNIVSNKLLILLLMFSMGMFLLSYLKNITGLNQSSALKGKENLQTSYFNVKSLIFDIFLPLLILIYQLLLIWIPAIFTQIKE